MKLIPTRPVTIERAPDAQRWFPKLHRHTDGSLLLYVENGHDLAFSPVIRTRSLDNGQTWARLPDLIPRCGWCHSFADGELLEVDCHPVANPRTEAEAVGLGAWSHPAARTDSPATGRIRFRNTRIRKTPCAEWLNGNPTMPWWPLWQDVCDFEAPQFDKVVFSGPMLTSGTELPDERLLALGYGVHRDPAVAKHVTCAYESRDRGRTWDEISVVTDLSVDGRLTNEAAVVRLKDGRLYAVLRTDGPLVHSWSEDDGRTWSKPTLLRLADETDHQPGSVWPWMIVLRSGALAMAYGRPGKHVVIDPTGTGTQWQARLDLHAWELETQALMGVPPAQRLRGVVGCPPGAFLDRYHDSSDYLGLAEIEANVLLAAYDVHGYVEHWNADPVASALRMVRVTIE